MYAIASIKGHQFKLEKNKWILIPHLKQGSGESVEINEVLAYKDDKKMLVGTPFVQGISIQAKVIEPLVKAKKIIVFKMKKRKRYRRKRGHRTQFTKVLIEDIVYT